MFERFTNRARRVVVLAQEEARRLKHDYIGTEHILLGLIADGEGTAARVLDGIGIRLDTVRDQVEQIIGSGKSVSSGGPIPFTPRAKKVLELSLREALQLGSNYIGTEHILLGIIREGHGVAAQILTSLGGDLSVVRMHVIRTTPADVEHAEDPFPGPAPGRIGFPEVLLRLQDISSRLATIEAHLGIARPSAAGGEGAAASGAGDDAAAGEGTGAPGAGVADASAEGGAASGAGDDGGAATAKG